MQWDGRPYSKRHRCAKVVVSTITSMREASTMQITTIGLDLAKRVFQVHAVDSSGHTVLVKQLKRSQMHEFFANLTPCVIGMEACASAHYWGRELTRLGHDVRLMAAQFVKPYVKTNKNDAADAQAICEAVSRPSMRFVAIKSVDQQAVLCKRSMKHMVLRSPAPWLNHGHADSTATALPPLRPFWPPAGTSARA